MNFFISVEPNQYKAILFASWVGILFNFVRFFMLPIFIFSLMAIKFPLCVAHHRIEVMVCVSIDKLRISCFPRINTSPCRTLECPAVERTLDTIYVFNFTPVTKVSTHVRTIWIQSIYFVISSSKDYKISPAYLRRSYVTLF